MKATEVVEAMTELKIAAQRAATALDDFAVAYLAVMESEGLRDEAERIRRDLQARTGVLNV